MKRIGLISTIVVVASLPLMISRAQSSMSPWPFFVEISSPAAPGIYETVLPLHVMDKAREDLADLRLVDAQGREIPYAVRTRKEVDESREIGARLFNQVRAGTNATEVSIDLGESPGEHNEAAIDTAGSNFRRRVDVEGSDTAAQWRTLKTGEVIFSFTSLNKIVDSNRVTYPVSRYRYLRLRVYADEMVDKLPPDITLAKVMMVAREPGVVTSWNVGIPPYQLLRNQGAPSSAWTIDLGARVPCDRLTLGIDNESFSREFQVENIDDPQNITLLTSGELTRRLNEKSEPLTIKFDKEVYARKLRVLIADYNNPALSITSIKAGAPARQLIFELKAPVAQPLRLFFGNAKASPPHYDFEKELSNRMIASPVHTQLGAAVSNPEFRPEPLPFTERVPWLIYLVLAASSVALALILFSLARATMRMPSKKSADAGP